MNNIHPKMQSNSTRSSNVDLLTENLKPPANIKRSRKLMSEKGIDFLLISTRENFYYFTGFKCRSASQLPMIAILSLDTDQIPLIMSTYHKYYFDKKFVNNREIYTYSSWINVFEEDILIKSKKANSENPKQFNLEDVINIICDLLKEKNLNGKIIAVENNFMDDPLIRSSLLKNFPKVGIVRGENLLWEIRKIKTNKEIEALKIAAEIGVIGLKTIIKDGVLNKTIGELQMKFKKGVMKSINNKNILEIDNIRAFISGSDYFSSFDNYNWSVSAGDMLMVDCGVNAFGYNSDMGRTFFINKPDKFKEDFYKALKEGIDKASSMITPGTKMKTLYFSLLETVREKGYDWYKRGHMGHMVGLGSRNIEQPPFISEEEETILEPGMVFCLECCQYTKHFGAFQIEDEFLVTPNGYEKLTKLPYEVNDIILSY